MYKLLTILSFFICSLAAAQSSDMLTLKKKGKTIKRYFKGDQIAFTTLSGASRNALITDIRHDSIFLQEFLVQQVPMIYGGYVLDTTGSFRYSYHYNEIARFGTKQKGFGLASGSSLIGGGILLSAGSGIVYLVDKAKYSPRLMLAGLSAIGIGYLLYKISSQPVIIGKKGYTLSYLNLQTK